MAEEISIETLRPGDSTSYPHKGDTVRVHYEGWLEIKAPSNLFDSSRARNTPLEFVVGAGQVIEGWEQCLPKLSVHQLAKVTIPPDMAYGSQGYPPIIPKDSTLIYEIELISICKAQYSREKYRSDS